MKTTELQVTETLSDKSSTGRERPWRYHKIMNWYLALAYDQINERTAQRLRECAPRLSFVMEDGRKKLKGAWFCRVRLCPMCTWRRSLKVSAQMHKIMSEIAASEKPLSYIFLTLTMKNCTGDDLDSSITALLQAYHRLTRLLPFEKVAKGWYRGLEITHNVDQNSKDYDTYHPHLHVVIAVNPSYFSSRDYLSQEKWTSIWQQALRCDYTPIVDVRKVKGNTTKAIAEAAKYACKVTDYIIPDDWELTVNTVRLLDSALHNRRLIAYGGIMRELHKKLNLDDADQGDLVHTNPDDKLTDDHNKPVYSFAWHAGYMQYTPD